MIKADQQVPEHLTTQSDSGYRIIRSFAGTALFVDVRKSSQIVQFVELHQSPQASAELFMDFLIGAMRAVDGPTVAWCVPSGDAVLAIFTGHTSTLDAVNAATRVISFVQGEFARDNHRYLTCDGRCGQLDCPGSLRLTVGAGIDVGSITVAAVDTGRHRGNELVGACISMACKLSGAVDSQNIIGISTTAFGRERDLLTDGRPWRTRTVRVGGRWQSVVITKPPAEPEDSLCR
jgi:class 3 adenylate cyclase